MRALGQIAGLKPTVYQDPQSVVDFCGAFVGLLAAVVGIDTAGAVVRIALLVAPSGGLVYVSMRI